jgi:hypothetical protein
MVLMRLKNSGVGQKFFSNTAELGKFMENTLNNEDDEIVSGCNRGQWSCDLRKMLVPAYYNSCNTVVLFFGEVL